jgi:hypothetical protein
VASAADADHDITFNSGDCKDSSNTIDIQVTSALTKQIDAAWSEGNNLGGLFSGSVAADTTYYLHIIAKGNGSFDAGFDTSETAANKPSGWDYYRQVGRIATNDSGNIDPLSIIGSTLADKIAFGESGFPRIKKNAIANNDAADSAGGEIIPILLSRSLRSGSSGSSAVAYTFRLLVGGTFDYFARIEGRTNTTSNAILRFRPVGGSNLINFSESGSSGQETGTVSLTASTSYEIVVEENNGVAANTEFYLNLGVSEQTAVGLGVVASHRSITDELSENVILTFI